MRTSLDPKKNNQGYTIIGGDYSRRQDYIKFTEACAKFLYKGFEVSFSTVNYTSGGCSNEVLVTDVNGVDYAIRGSVEDAINFIEKTMLTERKAK